jgi:hypothetical protein
VGGWILCRHCSNYEDALVKTYAPAAVYNTLAYCQFVRRQLEAAKANLDRALDLDLGMQAAWHNRAMYALQMNFHLLQLTPRGSRGSRPPDLAEKLQAVLVQGLQDTETALHPGPATDELHFNTAQLLALTRQGPDWAD